MTTVRMFTMKSFAILCSMTIALVALGPAQADPPKPKPKTDTPTETVMLKFTQVEPTYRVDGSPGPSVTVQGILHLGSKAFLGDDGMPIGFRLHGNLSGASALGADGVYFVAVGAAEGVPTECDPDACAPPFWTFTFRLVPLGSGLQPSLLFDLPVSTEYNEDGTLKSACVVGQEGCDTGGIVP